jgi:hypothetical protein
MDPEQQRPIVLHPKPGAKRGANPDNGENSKHSHDFTHTAPR